MIAYLRAHSDLGYLIPHLSYQHTPLSLTDTEGFIAFATAREGITTRRTHPEYKSNISAFQAEKQASKRVYTLFWASFCFSGSLQVLRLPLTRSREESDMSDCPNKEKNAKNCNCSYPCSRKGLCCECVAYHRRLGEIPGCFFSDSGEKQWDRSLQALIHDRR